MDHGTTSADGHPPSSSSGSARPRWATAAGAGVLAVAVFVAGYACTGTSSPSDKPAPSGMKGTVPSQTPAPSDALGAQPAGRPPPSKAGPPTRAPPAGGA